MEIGKVDIAKRVLIVAEIGNNHEGSFDRAMEMVKLAAECGVDAVKFQCIDPEHLGDSPERVAQLKRICLPWEAFPKLASVADFNNVMFLCTPFNPAAVKHLTPYVPAWKIASRSTEDVDLLLAAAKTKKPMIVSTGMSSNFEKVGYAAYLYGTPIVVLHCVSRYPTAACEANLQRITYMRTTTDATIPVGYSDHTLGIEAAVGAVYMGARVVEKHFTTDHNYSDFRDHQLSATPDELREMVERIRLAEEHCSSPG